MQKPVAHTISPLNYFGSDLTLKILPTQICMSFSVVQDHKHFLVLFDDIDIRLVQAVIAVKIWARWVDQAGKVLEPHIEVSTFHKQPDATILMQGPVAIGDESDCVAVGEAFSLCMSLRELEIVACLTVFRSQC